MKKVIYLIMLLFILVGCSNRQNALNPTKVTEEYIKSNFPNGSILTQRTDEDLHVALVEDENTVHLLVFIKEEDGNYKYSTGGSYQSNRQQYAAFAVIEDYNLLFIFSKNDDNRFKNIELEYTNANNEKESLTIKDKIDDINFIKIYRTYNYYDCNHIDLH